MEDEKGINPVAGKFLLGCTNTQNTTVLYQHSHKHTIHKNTLSLYDYHGELNSLTY